MSDPIARYHEQRDGLVGRKADHLTPPATYTRGVIPPEDKRRHRVSWLRVGLAVAFFALWAFVFLFGLMKWRIRWAF